MFNRRLFRIVMLLGLGLSFSGLRAESESNVRLTLRTVRDEMLPQAVEYFRRLGDRPAPRLVFISDSPTQSLIVEVTTDAETATATGCYTLALAESGRLCDQLNDATNRVST